MPNRISLACHYFQAWFEHYGLAIDVYRCRKLGDHAGVLYWSRLVEKAHDRMTQIAFDWRWNL